MGAGEIMVQHYAEQISSQQELLAAVGGAFALINMAAVIAVSRAAERIALNDTEQQQEEETE